jgi:hypothetical protein
MITFVQFNHDFGIIITHDDLKNLEAYDINNKNELFYTIHISEGTMNMMTQETRNRRSKTLGSINEKLIRLLVSELSGQESSHHEQATRAGQSKVLTLPIMKRSSNVRNGRC